MACLMPGHDMFFLMIATLGMGSMCAIIVCFLGFFCTNASWLWVILFHAYVLSADKLFK